MSNPYYDLYVQSVLALARSLVIKDSETARVVENQATFGGLTQSSGGVPQWRYYKNLAGEYHHRDVPMYVRSVDTLEDILFSKENLKEHLATAKEYQIGSEYYEQLVERYPEQETLIRGIVNPVDINKAVEAEDGTILTCDGRHVEFNESNLIPELETWIKRHYIRWNINSYGLVDELYPSAFLGVLYSLIPQVIFNIRLENCKTNYVHSYHVRQYLASHGQLDVYLDRLTTKQALWLYRNIDYIMRNAGKEETFSTLIQHILTERGIALASYEARHNLDVLSTELRPTPEMSLSFLNYNVGDDFRDIRPIEEILNRQVQVAPDNSEENDEAYGYVPRDLSLSMSGTEPTKVLESIVSDTSNNVAFSFSQLLINHWIYLTYNDRYTANVNVQHPETGETITLSAKEALVSYFYVFNKACGFVYESMPPLTVPWVKRRVPPTLGQLKSLVNLEHVDPADLQRSLVDHPPMGVYNTVEGFREYCIELRGLLGKHREIYILKEHMVERAHLEGALRSHWQEVDCDIPMPGGFDQWFMSRGLDFHLIEDGSLGFLSEALLEAGTGTDLSDANALRDLQDAMVGIMERLSSYSVQYLKTITSNTFFHAEWASMRTGETKVKGKAMSTHRNARLRPVTWEVKGNDLINSRMNNYSNYKVHHGVNPEKVFMEVMPEHRFKEMTYAKIRLGSSSIGVLGVSGENIYPPEGQLLAHQSYEDGTNFASFNDLITGDFSIAGTASLIRDEVEPSTEYGDRIAVDFGIEGIATMSASPDPNYSDSLSSDFEVAGNGTTDNVPIYRHSSWLYRPFFTDSFSVEFGIVGDMTMREIHTLDYNESIASDFEISGTATMTSVIVPLEEITESINTDFDLVGTATLNRVVFKRTVPTEAIASDFSVKENAEGTLFKAVINRTIDTETVTSDFEITGTGTLT